MPRRLTPQSSLDSLKKEAKRWLKALRENSADARARFERALAQVPGVPTLRDVQHAIARELGFPGWAAVKTHLEGRSAAADRPDRTVERFLENACPDHHVRGASDHIRAEHTAMRLLARYPEIRGASLATAIVCGDIDAVGERLTHDPSLVRKHSGAKGWEPLLYLAFTRLPLADVSANAVEIASLLLDHGADPNVIFMAGDSKYTPLVGVIGEGEENRPPHPRRDELVRLLLERGAEPYDIQVVYNIHFHGRVRWFLEVIYERSLTLGRKSDWDDPEWRMLDMGGYGSGARWHLWIALQQNDLELAEWCLTHGANPNAGPPRAKTLSQRSLYEEAMRRGTVDLAELLVRYGATRGEVTLLPEERLLFLAFRLNREAVQSLIAQHPDLREDGRPLFEAARRNRADVATLLLDAGFSPNVENDKHERALHFAAYANAVDAATLLISRGADIDPVESNWQNTPLDGAIYGRHAAMIDLLSRHSADLWALVFVGKLERVRELLSNVPALASATREGCTLLFRLPVEDEATAVDLARLLIANGADPRVAADAMTAADRADRLGMFELAKVLRIAASPPANANVARFEGMADRLLEAYRTGTAEAMERHWQDTWHRRRWAAMRRYVQLDLGLTAESEEGGVPASHADRVDITLDDARYLVARGQGHTSWEALLESSTESDADAGDRPRRMTNESLERLSQVEGITTVRLSGATAVTDEGLRHLLRMPALRDLDLSQTSITDRGLEILRQLPMLERINLSWTGISDAGAAHLAACDRLIDVDLSATRTGDAAIRALAGKRSLRVLRTGVNVTDAGVAALHDIPVFKTWHGGEAGMDLTSPDASPSFLHLRGAISDHGLANLVGLDGLFALNIDDASMPFAPAGLAPLVELPHFGWLALDATDASMPFVAALPHLRFLMCQDTSAGDDGFVALSRSRTIEYIWGRRCHNLRRRGFVALADMPALRHLSVSCKNVDDAGVSALPRFPALRELMPMDVPDAGYRHVGQCTALTSLVLMYCRDTGDVATSHVTGLPHLEKYFVSYNRITDRTPELLSTIGSLEQITIDTCTKVTDAGIAALARLPKLRELRVSGMRHVTPAGLTVFGKSVRVSHSP